MSLSLDQALPLFLFAVIFFIGLFFNDTFFNFFIKMGWCKKREEDEVDE
jgi:ABC-type microcin C transport system permease subunit YejB